MTEYISTGGHYDSGYIRKVEQTTTDMTKNESFERDGYLLIPNLIPNVEEYYKAPVFDGCQNLSGIIEYNRTDRATFTPQENQVPGSLSTYNYPQYRTLHYSVRKKIEKILGVDLLPTYHFDRFYYPEQKLCRHSDRPSCEVSVTIQISTNSNKPWPIWFERPDGSESYVLMNSGDGVVYKGCEREHWRDPLESKYGKWENKWRQFRKKRDDTYHHQLFLHYVNSQGSFVHHAYDTFGK